MLTDDRSSTRPISGRRLLGAGLSIALLLGACSSDTPGGTAESGDDRGVGPNSIPLPTIAGGVELPVVDPTSVLVGMALTFGEPLPSEQAAADAFAEEPEVSSAMARRVISVATTRVVALVDVLTLDGPEIFDEAVLDGFVQGVIELSAGGPLEEVQLGSQLTFRSVGDTTAAHGFRDGNLLVVVTAPLAVDATLVVERQLAARAAGVVGNAEPRTPMLPLAIDASFIAVPTVTFQPIPPAEDEPPPPSPALPGATGLQGRYGVVAGERRTVVWSFTVDPATYPSAERLAPAMAALVAARAGGTPARTTEVIDRVVIAADAAVGVDGALTARVFRHGALVLLVEGADPAQVDAVVADWISTLAR